MIVLIRSFGSSKGGVEALFVTMYGGGVMAVRVSWATLSQEFVSRPLQASKQVSNVGGNIVMEHMRVVNWIWWVSFSLTFGVCSCPFKRSNFSAVWTWWAPKVWIVHYIALRQMKETEDWVNFLKLLGGVVSSGEWCEWSLDLITGNLQVPPPSMQRWSDRAGSSNYNCGRRSWGIDVYMRRLELWVIFFVSFSCSQFDALTEVFPQNFGIRLRLQAGLHLQDQLC